MPPTGNYNGLDPSTTMFPTGLPSGLVNPALAQAIAQQRQAFTQAALPTNSNVWGIRHPVLNIITNPLHPFAAVQQAQNEEMARRAVLQKLFPERVDELMKQAESAQKLSEDPAQAETVNTIMENSGVRNPYPKATPMSKDTMQFLLEGMGNTGQQYQQQANQQNQQTQQNVYKTGIGNITDLLKNPDFSGKLPNAPDVATFGNPTGTPNPTSSPAPSGNAQADVWDNTPTVGAGVQYNAATPQQQPSSLVPYQYINPNFIQAQITGQAGVANNAFQHTPSYAQTPTKNTEQAGTGYGRYGTGANQFAEATNINGPNGPRAQELRGSAYEHYQKGNLESRTPQETYAPQPNEQTMLESIFTPQELKGLMRQKLSGQGLMGITNSIFPFIGSDGKLPAPGSDPAWDSTREALRQRIMTNLGVTTSPLTVPQAPQGGFWGMLKPQNAASPTAPVQSIVPSFSQWKQSQGVK